MSPRGEEAHPTPGVVVIVALADWNLAAMRAQVTSARRVGALQTIAGLVVVAVSAIGVLVGA